MNTRMSDESDLPLKRHYTPEEVAEIARKQHLTRYPKLAVRRHKLSMKAENEPEFRFYVLFGQVSLTDTLRCAYHKVRANGGCAGVDGVTFEDIERSEGGRDRCVANIQKEIRERTYRAQPLKRVYIEKENGRQRPLGIPVIKDRIVQAAVKLVIEPIFEADFNDCSYGFRPNRSAQQAVTKIAENIRRGETQIYDADLSSYFDTIPQDKIIKALRMRIVDKSLLALIRQWLKAPVREPDGTMKSAKGKGTPQGGVISPLLSNIYLHWFERIAQIEGAKMGQQFSIVRYADDFVLTARELKEGFVRKVEDILEKRMELKVNREKTRTVDMRADKAELNFLGYGFRYVKDRLYGTGRKYLTYGPSKKSVKKVCRGIKTITLSRNGLVPIPTIVKRLNERTKGWAAYFSVGYPSMAFQRVNYRVLCRMARFMNRRSQRRYHLKFAKSYYGELQHYGWDRLRWCDFRKISC